MLSLLRRRLRAPIATSSWPAAAPETIGRQQPVFDASRCDLNGACRDACPVAAITVGASFALDRARCIACSRCIDACPTHALAAALTFPGPASSRAALLEPPTLADAGRTLSARARTVLGRSLHVRHLDAGSCNGCDWEINAIGNAVHDVQRFGIDFVASPRHADVLLVTGTVTRNLAIAARRTYDAMSEPRLVIAVGACATSGSPFEPGYASGNGAADAFPVDIFVPGCPPRPEAIIQGLLAAVGRMNAVRR